MTDKTQIAKEAQKYLARGQIDKAIAEWEKLTKEHPDAGVFNTMGDLYLKTGNKSSAIDSYHQAAHFSKEDGFALKSLAIYKKILNIDPEDDRALLALGELNEAKGLVSDAIKFYLAAVDSLSKTGDKKKVFALYDRILMLSPSNVPLRIKFADLYVKEGLILEAIEQYFLIAHHLAESGDVEKASGYYQKILGMDKLNRRAHLELSALYEKSGNRNRSIAQIEEAITLLPQDSEILLKAAELYGAHGEFTAARECLQRVESIEPENPRTKKILGDLYLKEGNRQKAWEVYSPVLDDILLEEDRDAAVSLLESFKDIDPVETGKRLITLFLQWGDNQRLLLQLRTLGDIFMRGGKQREALNYYREAFRIAPDDESLRDTVVELEKQFGKEHIEVAALNAFNEALIEADIYKKYGLFDKARDILETFQRKEPENIELHLKLKLLYTETGKTDEAVAECLILHTLFQKSGDAARGSAMIQEAFALNPEDPRLVGFVSAATEVPPEAETTAQEPSIGNYQELIVEADIYARQGLVEKAREIYGRLSLLFPERAEFHQKLAELGQMAEEATAAELDATDREERDALSVPENAIPETGVMPDSPQDSGVMVMFEEFKKGLEKEIEAGDYETHYNLGIAYKEMGLIDDAIRELQISRNDPKRFVHASSLLGSCYMEKGLYPSAIDILKSSLAEMKDRDESYWTMLYDLAIAYEKNHNIEEALAAYLQVHGWNAQFRETSQKIDALKAAVRNISDQQKLKERKDRVSYL